MGKNNDIQQLINLLAKSLCHRIGSMVNNTQVYAKKYYLESSESRRISLLNHRLLQRSFRFFNMKEYQYACNNQDSYCQYADYYVDHGIALLRRTFIQGKRTSGVS